MYEFVQVKRDLILKVANQHGIQNVRVLDMRTILDNEQIGNLDLLVEFEKGRSLFDMIRFKQEIEDLLCISVNILTESSIHWSIKEDVLNRAFRL